MNRVKKKVEAEIDKKQTLAGQKRSPSIEKLSTVRRRRSRSQQRGGSGATALPPSPTVMSLASTNTTLPIPTSGGPTGSPTSAFTPVGVNGTPTFTAQSQTGSSPDGPEPIYPFTMNQGIYIPFGNSPPLFPVSGQHQSMQLPTEMMDVTHENDGSGQFWHSLFVPSGNPLPPPHYVQAIAHPALASVQQGNLSPGVTTGEFRDPNDIRIDMEDPVGINFDEIDNGLVDWGDFIAQCSQVWVTE